MEDLERLFLVRNQAIDMDDRETIEAAQREIDLHLGKISVESPEDGSSAELSLDPQE